MSASTRHHLCRETHRFRRPALDQSVGPPGGAQVAQRFHHVPP